MYNVWIVDDEPFILEGLAGIVNWQSMGLVLAGQAENGLDALEQIDARQAQVDMLITDIAMPEMDGLALLRELKKRNPELKAIILSGYNEFDYIKEGMNIGIENYLLKPINLEELRATLIHAAEMLNRARIDRLSRDQVGLLKDNILYRWVANRIGQEQWQLRSEFLGLRLQAPAVAAAVVRLAEAPDPTGRGELLQRGREHGEGQRQVREHGEGQQRMSSRGELQQLVRERTEAFMAQSAVPHLCFQNTDDDTVLLIGAQNGSADSLDGLISLLDGFAAEQQQSLGLRPVVALGSLETGFERAPDSYRNALLALEYALLYPGERVLAYPRLATMSGSDYSPAADADAYARLVLAHDLDVLSKQIEEDFEAFSRMEGMKPETLRHGALEMVMQMKKLLKDAPADHPAYQSYHDTVNRILSSVSLEQLKELVLSMATAVSDALGERQEMSPVIRHILKEIETAYAKEYSLKTLAQAHRVHPVYLGQLFQKETGQSFSDYLNRLRIDKATELMRSTPMKMQEIAEAVGYWDTAHFYKHFKKYVGVAPAQYRKLQ